MYKIITDKINLNSFKSKDIDLSLEEINISLIEDKEEIIFYNGEVFIECKLLQKLVSEINKYKHKRYDKYYEKLAKLKMKRIDKIETGFYRKSKKTY